MTESECFSTTVNGAQDHLATFMKWWGSLDPRPPENITLATMELIMVVGTLPVILDKISFKEENA